MPVVGRGVSRLYTAMGIIASLPVMAAAMLVLDWFLYEGTVSAWESVGQILIRAAVGLLALGGIAVYWRTSRPRRVSWLITAMVGCGGGILLLSVVLFPFLNVA